MTTGARGGQVTRHNRHPSASCGRTRTTAPSNRDALHRDDDIRATSLRNPPHYPRLPSLDKDTEQQFGVIRRHRRPQYSLGQKAARISDPTAQTAQIANVVSYAL